MKSWESMRLPERRKEVLGQNPEQPLRNGQKGRRLLAANEVTVVWKFTNSKSNIIFKVDGCYRYQKLLRSQVT